MGGLTPWHALAFIAACGTVGSVYAQGPNRNIVVSKDGDFSAEVSAGTKWCRASLVVTARGQDENVFEDRSKLARLAVGIRSTVSRECPQARTIIINGFVDDTLVYRATIARPRSGGDTWPLIETPAFAAETLPEPPPPLPTQARAQREPSLESVMACDREAAHPDDPTKPASVEGVNEEAMHAGRALEFCEDALLYDPNNTRVMYQLARAYLLYDRPVEGVELMTEAAEEGHPVAIASLGDIALYGLLGDAPDPELARELYTRAAGAGFQPAAQLAAAIQDNPEEDTTQMAAITAHFHQAQLMAQLQRGQAIPGQGDSFFRSLVYAASAIGGIKHHCPDAGLRELQIPRMMDVVAQRMGPLQMLAHFSALNEGAFQSLQQQGMDDGYALAFTKGCTSTEIRSVHDSLHRTIN